MNEGEVDIMLIEDNAGDARLIREMLSETDHATARLHSFGTLQEALAAPIARGTVSTILLDLNLPDSEGLQTLLAIKDLFADSAIVVLTGLDDERMAIQALREGAQNYLRKDEVHPEMLSRTLRHSIERHGFIKRLRESDRISMERDHRFRMLVEHSADLTLMVDRRGDITYASPAVRRAFGYPRNQRLNVFPLLHRDDALLTRQNFEQVLLRPGMPLPMMVRAKACDGQYLWLEGTINNLLNVPGMEGIVVNFHDSTDRIELEHRVAFDRSNLNALINSTQDLVWSVDRDLRLIAANETFLGALERATDMRLRPGDDLMALPDVPGMRSVREWRSIYERALTGEYFTLEERIAEPEVVYSEMSFGPIREGNEVVGVACFGRDVTKRKLLEERLRRNEATMAQVQSIAHFGSWELNIDDTEDPNAGPHGWSDEVYRIVGLDPATTNVNLRTFFDLVHPDDRRKVRSALEGTILSGTPYSIDHRIIRPDGAVRWLHEEGARVLGPGPLRRVLGTVHDISERKSIEDRIHRLNAELEDRVVERTTELILANEELEVEIGKNQKLTELLTQRNNDFMASIGYARRIQNALFPASVGVDFFSDTACLSRPKDVVSGDFVWHYDTTGHLFLAVADCTGHGVPGALMSILGHSLLNQMVEDRGIRSPQIILTEMDQSIEDLFTHHKSDDRVHDGMDIGCFKLDKGSMELLFSGALMRCLVLRDGKLTQLDCSRNSLGGHMPHMQKEFNQARFQLRRGDRIMLSTDGYQSQFGGPHGKKMKAHEFRALLERTNGLSAAQAVAFLESEFARWRGEEEQIDDVLVVILDV